MAFNLPRTSIANKDAYAFLASVAVNSRHQEESDKLITARLQTLTEDIFRFQHDPKRAQALKEEKKAIQEATSSFIKHTPPSPPLATINSRQASLPVHLVDPLEVDTSTSAPIQTVAKRHNTISLDK